MKPHPKNIVGPYIGQARRSRKPALSQLALSKWVNALGVHIDRAGIAKIETGKRCVCDFELAALALALRVPLASLIKKRN